MIVKFEDHHGTSFFDNVFMVTKLDGEEVVRMSQVVIGVDPTVAVRDFDHGRLICYSHTGSPLQTFELGPAMLS